jgi:sulfur carrier protein
LIDLVVITPYTLKKDTPLKIKVNGEEMLMDSPSISITEILKINKVETPEMVSVQLNGNFVERQLFPATLIKENDEIDFLYFMGGGSE